MHSTGAMFLRATATRRIPERLLDKVHSKVAEYKVSPFGLLQLRVSDCSPKVVPLDYSLYPNGDRVIISHCAGCHVDKHRTDFVPTKGNDPEVLSLSCVNSEHAEYCGCIVQVPNHISLDISASGDADVKISSVEPAQCHISSDYSSVHLHKVKTGKATIFANNGSVEITNNLIGNINIKTGVGGFVRGDRLQGSSIKIDTFKGPIDCKSIYGESVQLSSREGNITVKNLHGEVKVWSTGGNVDIGSLEGSLELSTGRGNSAVNVTNSEKIKITAMEGNVSLGLSHALKSHISLSSPSPIDTGTLNLKTQQDPDIQTHQTDGQTNKQTDGQTNKQTDGQTNKTQISGFLNDASAENNSALVEVVAQKGRISVHTTSWFSSLNLGTPEEEKVDINRK